MNPRASTARVLAVLIKELTQMRRDHLTFGMILMIPLVQLVIFGFAINTDPKHLPTALHLEEQSPIVSRLVQAMGNSDYFEFVSTLDDADASRDLLAKGKVAFVISVPAGFTRRLIRGEQPALLIEADASDPSASSNAIAAIDQLVAQALSSELRGSLSSLQPKAVVEVRVLRHYNPEGRTQYNIVPGLLGVILTMTMVMITSMAMTREAEQGTMENLLAMPTHPAEVMVGKIAPYVLVGSVQTLLVLSAAYWLFGVPFAGSVWVLVLGVALFVLANLSLGFTFSTIARSQMQAMQMTFFFFLPSILLSGFMFPFRGMPHWAQAVGEMLPLTHFLRIVRGVMLKESQIGDLSKEFYALAVFTLIVGVIAVKRYKRTLD